MINHATIQKECKFGIPAADQTMFNRYYTVGYSYFLRQAKWVLEIVNPNDVYELEKDIPRSDNFRPDFRVPVQFRADLIDFKGSGFDRGHLVPSANQNEIDVQNSETFLLSNMSPQHPNLNRRKWRELEHEVRKLNDENKVLETYVATGPIIDLSQPTEFIGIDPDDKNEMHDNYEDIDVTIPVPHKYFKSVMIETNRGRHYMWSFIMENREETGELDAYLVPTKKVELMAGLTLWPELTGDKIEEEKRKPRKMWKAGDFS